MTVREEKIFLNAVHKWVATTITVCGIIWGMMAYYVQSENEQTRLRLQSQITTLQQQQLVDIKIQQIVIEVDKKLSSIETSLKYQSTLILEVQELREEVNKLKVELARQG